MDKMTNSQVYSAALIIIGNEILSGKTQDANTQYIAGKLAGRGIVLSEVRVVPDIEEKIIRAVNALRTEVDYVFTTGGIGPTHDDITAECIAKAFGAVFERNKEAYALLEKHYGPGQVNEARARMAMMPQGAGLIPNPVSTAPGFFIENVYVMAGVPRIMQAMFDHVIGTLKEGATIHVRTVACVLPESLLAKDLGEIQGRYATVDIGSYPHFKDGKIGLSLVLRGIDEDAIGQATAEVAKMVQAYGGIPIVA